MEFLSESEFRKQIAKKPATGYLFFGDEDYMKSYALKTAREQLCPDEALAPFNNIHLDGLDLTPELLLQTMSTLPMMSERKLIEIRGLTFRGEKGESKGESGGESKGEPKKPTVDDYVEVFELLSEYDYNTVILVMSAGAIDEGYNVVKNPPAVLKKLGSVLTPVRFTKAGTVTLARWVERHFLANGVRANAAVCTGLIDYCGTDMFTLATEIDKLSWYALVQGRDEVLPEDIKAAAIADTGYDTYAFSNAIMVGDKVKALEILAEQIKRKIAPPIIMAEITGTVGDMLTARLLADEGMRPTEIAAKISKLKGSRVNEYKVKLCLQTGVGAERLRAVMDRCVQTDAAIKLSPNSYTEIERFVCAL